MSRMESTINTGIRYKIERLGPDEISFSTYMGVFIYHEETKEWTAHNAQTGMVSPWVHTHRRDMDGVDWFGTASGVISHKDGHYGRFTISDGLPDNVVRDIEIGDDGFLWFATDGGLAVYAPDKNGPSVSFSNAPSELQYGRPAVLLVRGFDAFEDTPNNQLVYQWRLDDGGWMTHEGRCEIQIPPYLSPGRHVIEAVCIDRDHQVSLTAQHNFTIVLPLLARPAIIIPWTLLLLASVLAAALALLNWRRLAASLVELREARDRALSADRMKSQFVATMSHEIRTPLNVIIGYSDLLEESEEDADRREMLGFVRRSGRTLLQLINDILDFSRIEAGHMQLQTEPADIRELANELNVMVSLRASEKGVNIGVNVDKDVPESLMLDARRLRQVILNLLGNALRFTDRGGVRLHVTMQREDSGSLLVIEVEDDGIGIPADRLEDVFKPFVQLSDPTTRAHGGTGLGLSICQRLVRAMSGSIEVNSREGEGTCFRVTVPVEIAPVEKKSVLPEIIGEELLPESLQEEPPVQIVEKEMSEAPAIGTVLDAPVISSRVLLYGGESRSRGFLERLLRNLNYEPCIVESIDVFRTEIVNEPPLAVFLDVSESGHEAGALRSALEERHGQDRVMLVGVGNVTSNGGPYHTILRSNSDISHVRRLLRELSTGRGRASG